MSRCRCKVLTYPRFPTVIASAAVPWIINPVVLLRKNKDGTLSAAEFQGRHKDGSLRVDIPLRKSAAML